MYVGAWDSNSWTSIDGVAVPFVGAALCFTGSASGATCGNIVENTNVQYTLPEVPGATITGARSKQLNGIPSVGNGDSGGPGVLVTISPTGAEDVYASTIISAQYGGQDICLGEPSSPTRKCSHDIVSTSVSTAAGIMNWTVSTLSDY